MQRRTGAEETKGRTVSRLGAKQDKFGRVCFPDCAGLCIDSQIKKNVLAPLRDAGFVLSYSFNAACAAANLAMGTRNGEQET